MKTKEIYHQDSFKDKLGKEHQFILCGLTETYPSGRQMLVGLSVTNPIDKFNEVMGKKIARGRAIKTPLYAVGTSNSTMLTVGDVSLTIKLIAERIKERPQNFVKSLKPKK